MGTKELVGKLQVDEEGCIELQEYTGRGWEGKIIMEGIPGRAHEESVARITDEKWLLI